MCAGDIIKPQGAFQSALFWLMPVIQPLLCLVMAGLAAFTVAYAGVAALHLQPYVAPLLVRVLCCKPHKGTAWQHHIARAASTEACLAKSSVDVGTPMLPVGLEM